MISRNIAKILETTVKMDHSVVPHNDHACTVSLKQTLKCMESEMMNMNERRLSFAGPFYPLKTKRSNPTQQVVKILHWQLDNPLEWVVKSYVGNIYINYSQYFDSPVILWKSTLRIDYILMTWQIYGTKGQNMRDDFTNHFQ